MKKRYSNPKYEFIVFDESDVMTYSYICSDPADPKYYEAVGGYADSNICFIGEFTEGDDMCG